MKAVRRLIFVILITAIAIMGSVWWRVNAPPPHLVIAPAYAMGDTPASIVKVTAPGDPIAEKAETFATEIIGHDDVVLQEHLGRAFAGGMDGWIWQIDLETLEAKQLVDVPLMAAGMSEFHDDDDRIAFCASHLSGGIYPEGEEVGLYELKISTGEVTPLLQRVPLPPAIEPPAAGNEGTVFTSETEPRLRFDEMNDTNSRPLAFCNDFDISADGQRFYISEPFPYEGASMGSGAFGEAITLGKNGRLWRFDRSDGSASLVAQDYNFIDGVLLEEIPGEREHAVLVTETTKFRILRLNLTGEKAGKDEVLWRDLPSMPDGMERDSKGRIWVGTIKERTGLLTWAHKNPWIKPFMLRLPLEMLPVPEVTAILALSPDASEALYYTKHAGTHVMDISAVVPGATDIYMMSFNPANPGLHRMPNPLDEEQSAEPPVEI